MRPSCIHKRNAHIKRVWPRAKQLRAASNAVMKQQELKRVQGVVVNEHTHWPLIGQRRRGRRERIDHGVAAWLMLIVGHCV